MGEIVIKVPENVHEVVDLGLSYREVKAKLEEIEKSKSKEFLRFLIENAGRLKDEDLPPEEKIYMQGD